MVSDHQRQYGPGPPMLIPRGAFHHRVPIRERLQNKAALFETEIPVQVRRMNVTIRTPLLHRRGALHDLKLELLAGLYLLGRCAPDTHSSSGATHLSELPRPPAAARGPTLRVRVLYPLGIRTRVRGALFEKGPSRLKDADHRIPTELAGKLAAVPRESQTDREKLVGTSTLRLPQQQMLSAPDFRTRANRLFLLCCEKSARTGAFDQNVGIELHVRSRKSLSCLR